MQEITPVNNDKIYFLWYLFQMDLNLAIWILNGMTGFKIEISV